MEPPVFARYNFGDIVLTDEERASHVYIIGRSGTGKSTVAYNMALADILTINDDTGRPRGLALIDPHGDLIDQLIDAIPPSRTNDVVVIDAADTEYAVGFNPVANVAVQDRHLAASGSRSARNRVVSCSSGCVRYGVYAPGFASRSSRISAFSEYRGWYGRLFFTMCHRMVRILRASATRALFLPLFLATFW